MRSGFALSDRAISNDEDPLTYLLSTGYVDMPRERLPHAKTSNLWVCGAHMFSISTAADSEWIPLQRTRNIFFEQYQLINHPQLWRSALFGRT